MASNQTFSSGRLISERRRPATRRDFEIAVICALTLEADAVDALFDCHWDDGGSPYDKIPGDPNAYSTGAIGRHNVVLAHMPGMGKASAAAVAANCRISFPNIKLGVVVGVCGAVPFDSDGAEIVLGDVIVSDGVVQYDLGWRLPERFKRKDTLLDSLSRPNSEIRSLLAKLKTRRSRKMLRDKMATYMKVLQAEPDLISKYPGVTYDKLFEATYGHVADGETCDKCGCDGPLVLRSRLEQDNPMPAVHFGLIASGDTVMKSGEERDAIARQENIVGFEMEGSGVWDSIPCVVIKGACDYADSHKTKVWQRYAAATAAACMKAFLDDWVPLLSSQPEEAAGPWFLVPYPRNENFVGRTAILEKLQQPPKPDSQVRISLFGLGGIGKTQIALEHSYQLRETCADMSVFWVHGSNAERFRQSYTSIALECRIPGFDDPEVDVLLLVKQWLERKDRGQWLMVIDNADDAQLFFPSSQKPNNYGGDSQEKGLGQYIPECARGSILITTRNKQAGLQLAQGRRPIKTDTMNNNESEQLLRAYLGEVEIVSDELTALSGRLEHLPLALVQAAAFIEANSITVTEYICLLDKGDQDLVNLLHKEFETVGRDSETPRAVAETWILSFEQIQQQNAFAAELLSLMSLFDRQAIPIKFLTFYTKQQHEERRSKMQLIDALGVLKAFSFVTSGKDQSLDMHRLIQLVTRKWLANKDTAKHFTDYALLAVSHHYPFGKFENRAICSTYLPHALTVLELEGTRSKEEIVARASLINCIAGFLYFEGKWEDAMKLNLWAVELREEVLGAKHHSTLTSMTGLASTYRKQGRWEEAEKLQVQVMESRKVKLGANHSKTLLSMNNLALTYGDQGRWEEAEKLQVQVIETCKVKLRADHPRRLISMANLALTYRKQGRWEEAEKLQVQVMETRKVKLGDDHPDTLTSMNHLAWTWKSQGRLADALALMRSCVYAQQRILGPEHPDTLFSLEALNQWSG